ncbi:MAG: transglutaminase protein [Segetibacter sp.]|nr:transglutaminase protein [Segetibacter sp.]
MKKLLFLVCITFRLSTSAQDLFDDVLPVIHSNNPKADYRIENDWTRNSWGINPDVSPDVLQVYCSNTPVSFGFYTDVDSIVFPLKPGESKQFYVLTKDGKFALTEIKAIPYSPISFNTTNKKPSYSFWYEPNINNAYLRKLKNDYGLEKLVEGSTTEKEKALKVLNWVHKQWPHNGNNEPKKSDAISILQEAKEGKNFRCVEYGIVTTACLNALGMPARVLGLKTKDVETTEAGAGHVLLEVYMKDYKKWVLLDGQFDIMPVLNHVPLNAVEFRHAIVNHYDDLELQSLSGTTKRRYVNWVFPYLYYFDVNFDNRQSEKLVRQQVKGKTSLMLVPQGAKEPTVFQKRFLITYCAYTNSLADFYAAPSFNTSN